MLIKLGILFLLIILVLVYYFKRPSNTTQGYNQFGRTANSVSGCGAMPMDPIYLGSGYVYSDYVL
jgi:hypothetical protein